MVATPEPSILGTPHKRDRDEWLLLALISDEDLEPAVAYWRQNVSSRYAGLLDSDGWDFDEQKQQYVSDSARSMTPAEQKELAAAFTVTMEKEIESTTLRMAAGEIEIGQWQDRVAGVLKNGYVALGALGVGGIGRLTEEDRDVVTGEPGSEVEWLVEENPSIYTPRIGTGLADAYMRLARFGDQIEQKDDTASTPDQIANRSGQYAAAGHAIYEESRRSGHGRANDEDGNPLFLFERNVLDDAAEHCHETEFTEGCPQLTELGWMPIGSLPAPGLRSCRSNCRCQLEFSQTGENLNE